MLSPGVLRPNRALSWGGLDGQEYGASAARGVLRTVCPGGGTGLEGGAWLGGRESNHRNAVCEMASAGMGSMEGVVTFGVVTSPAKSSSALSSREPLANVCVVFRIF